ncbi:biotin--[acetyl-CoA-carboxylase] ligase [Sphaerotilus sp.]|uniref:biotin--[acetyl-CoA-carboxylase] ligase n=1 Tax=Sphaerotilus sp. TaxID=2093942 RepID=UPI00286D6D07|nr:biotin--[acetyl-CoA-carboxylase] ligase [Sphaerotilus sp.]
MLHWDAETLWQDLEPRAPGLSVEVLAETGSTNTLLLERGRQGLDTPCLLVAECQTAGRGRLGRPWWSQPGQALTFSLGIKLAPADWSGLSLAVGVALSEALGAQIGLKWPNDLWLRGDDRKLGGILIEVAPLAEPGPRPGERWVVIGAGLNVTPLPDAQADADTFRTGYACLQAFEPMLTAPQLLHRVARPLLDAVLAFETDGLAPLRTRYAARDVLAGRTVQAGAITGIACGLTADGSLQVRDVHGTIHALHSGEVSVRPC